MLGTLVLLYAGQACREDTESPTAPQAGPALATTAAALSFRQVSSGWAHTCGVTTDDLIYCWGENSEGALGDGTTISRLRPVRVTGGFRWREVTAGGELTCGITVDDRAYCWGTGLLGDGSEFRTQVTPVAVAGGLSFRHVSNNPLSSHTCGITTDERAYCWGSNSWGQLGDSTTESFPSPSLRPVAVTGGRHFRKVSAGPHHTCAVDPSGRIWCWGLNFSGQLGDGTGTPSGLGCLNEPFQCRSSVPVRVHGSGLVFRQVSAGGSFGGPAGFGGFTCGVTTDDRAYCWGSNNIGQLGNDGTHDLTTPHPVAGDHHFRQVSAGELHACGITPQNKAYCWGRNEFGTLGDGTDAFRQRHPVPVVGGLQFSSVSAGFHHTCAVTQSGAAYCWGANGAGQLGIGSTRTRKTPVAVIGP